MVYGSRKIAESVTTTGTTWLYNTTTQGEMSSSGGLGFGVGVGVGVAGGPTLAAAQQGQGVAALLVMLAVLCFIFAYCCWGAPFCRSLCRRHCCCRLEDPEPDSRFSNNDQTMVATPTIILLPHGRMLVVDGTIFTQFQTDPTGLDLVELGDSVLRAQRNPRSINRHQLQNSQGSILEMDAETPSKDSLGSVGCFPPPTYESIYGKEESDMPPSYSDILLHRFANLPHDINMHNYCHDSKEEIEMQSLDGCPHILSNPMNTIAYPYATVTNFSSQSFPRRNVSRNPSIISNPLDSYYVDNELELYRLSQEMVPRVFSNTNFEALRTYQDETSFYNMNGNESEQQNDMLSNNGNYCTSDNNIQQNNERIVSNNIDEVSNNITANELMNTRNLVRSISRISQESRNNIENSQRDNQETGIVFVRLPHSENHNNSHTPQNWYNNTNENDRPAIQVNQENQSTLRNMHSENEQMNETNHNIESNSITYYIRNQSTDEARSHRLENESAYSDEEPRNFGALADIRESRV
ncbi:GATA zinc finger domain-containing protein 14-like [Apis dorsata]|uniref:GATA zinc finger domain-containing protein 14-like n=1 Tax=Apis dorsata TaxID=7462 RepID=UPI0003DF749E|nr:GATA zinc finger domain-containing protein 14-like [Apis dorsata]